VKDFVVTYDVSVLPDDPVEFVKSFEDFTLDETMKWFTNPSEVGRNQPLLKSYSRFANENKDRSICFIIKVNSFNPSDAPFELKLEKAGELLVNEFVPPGLVAVSKLTTGGRGYDYLELEIFHPEITDLRPVLKVFVEKFYGSGNKFFVQNMTTMSTSTMVKIDGLDPDTLYYVSFEIHLYLNSHFADPIKSCDKKTGCIGSGGRSQKFPYVTLPSSPPSDVRCEPKSENSLEFSWNHPIKVAPSITVDQYEYTHIVDDIGNLTMDKVVNFDNLMPATPYSFSVKYNGGKKSVKIPINGANCTDPEADCLELKLDLESPSAMITCTTLPTRLTGLSHSKVTPNEITLNWNQYQTMADNR
jgi:hypothetical protein